MSVPTIEVYTTSTTSVVTEVTTPEVLEVLINQGVPGPAGVVRTYTATIGNGSATTITVTHNLNTKSLGIQVYDTSAPFEVKYPTIRLTTANSFDIIFSVAPTTNQYTVTVIG